MGGPEGIGGKPGGGATPVEEGGKEGEKKAEGGGKEEGISKEEYEKLPPEEQKKYIPDPENEGKFILDVDIGGEAPKE